MCQPNWVAKGKVLLNYYFFIYDYWHIVFECFQGELDCLFWKMDYSEIWDMYFLFQDFALSKRTWIP